jgi:hypothetical protein
MSGARVLGLILFLVVCGPEPATAGVNRWTSQGPFGGQTMAVAVSPGDSGLVFVGTGVPATVYRSTDGGTSWSVVDRGVEHTVGALAVYPTTPSTVYSGSAAGVRTSTDGGDTWRSSGTGLRLWRVEAVAADPSNPGVVYAGGWSLGSDRESLFKSSDGGESWHASSTGLPDLGVDAVVIDESSPSTLYAGHSGGVHRSTDAGSSWHPAGSGMIGGWVNCLAMSDSRTLYAAAGDGVFRSIDGGDTWQAMLEGPWTRTVAIDPVTPSTVYAGTSEVLKSTDGGVTWIAVAQGLQPVSVRALAVDRLAPSVVFAATSRAGVIVSSDTGQSWRTSNSGLRQVAVSDVVAVGAPLTLYAVDDYSFYLSTDHGRSWDDGSLIHRHGGFTRLAVDRLRPSTVFVAGHGGVYKSSDRGASWREVLDHTSGTPALAIDQVEPTALYSAWYYNRHHGSHRSTDGGESWELLFTYAEAFITALATDPSRAGTVFVGGRATHSGIVHRSTDRGVSWSPVSDGLPAEGWIRHLHVGPSGARVFAVEHDEGLFRSTDAGSTWVPVRHGLEGVRVHAVAVDPGDPDTVWAATGSGAYRSIDSGATWVRVAVGLDEAVNAVAVDGVTGTVVAGTASGVSLLQPVTRLALHDGRFSVEVEWTDYQALRGPGSVASLTVGDPVPVRSRDSAVLEFFSAGNWEVLVKVLDGRGLNGHHWLFLAAATDVEYTATVRDTACGQVRTYANPLGTEPRAVTDVEAFPGCDEPAAPSCVPDGTTTCLGPDGRFAMQLEWRDFAGGTGFARQAEATSTGLTASNDSGLFSFFADNNWELLVKVLDGCAINGHYWVYAAAASDVELQMTVTDTLTGLSRLYTNPLGVDATAITDERAFPSCFQ